MGAEQARFVAELPLHPLAVVAARKLVRLLDPWVPIDRLRDIELIVSELVTNAVRYSDDPVDGMVELELSSTPDAVTGWVHNDGPMFEIPTARPEPDQIGGFGLHIAERLASSLTIERTPSGNRVRFTVPRRPPTPRSDRPAP